MHLIQILLPLYDNEGQALSGSLHAEVKSELTEKFGGLTAYVRSPAEGRWKASTTEVRDEIVIYEVMADSLDKDWWKDCRERLETLFLQDEIIVRALPMRSL
jgi:hypothetical protein